MKISDNIKNYAGHEIQVPFFPGHFLNQTPSTFDFNLQNYFKQRRNVSKLRKTATFLFLDPDLLPFLLKRLNIFKIAPWPAEKEFLKQVKFNF